jgi:DNA-binding response OmpR family regulator
MEKIYILVVDDYPINAEYLKNILEAHYYDISYAQNAASALKLIYTQKFDLLLLDVNMPGTSGFDLCESIRSNAIFDDLPIVFLTGQADRHSILRGFEVGAQDYITKPFNPPELIARVKTQTEIKKSKDKIQAYLRIIEEKNKQTTESIWYAHYIQQAIQLSVYKHTNNLPEHFIVYLPKDIVSGDFYYFQKIGDYILAGIFDATGHGIPGAFMSILGINLLNEIILREKCLQPSIILNKLRKKIMETLDQKGEMQELKDGLDGVLLSYHTKKKLLAFSGAFNSAYVLRKEQLIELCGERMPLSYYVESTDFTEQYMTLEPGDTVYLFTDGFPDQFGGPKNKKFKIKQLKQMLIQIGKKSFEEQKLTLLETFHYWKGENEQVDDVSLIGINYFD